MIRKLTVLAVRSVRALLTEALVTSDQIVTLSLVLADRRRFQALIHVYNRDLNGSENCFILKKPQILGLKPRRTEKTLRALPEL